MNWAESWALKSTLELEAPRQSTQNKDSRIIDILAKIALNNEPVAAARIAAAIVFKNDIIAIGTNSHKTHPFHAKFSNHPLKITLHAETSAIKNALRLISQKELAKCTLYITRIKYLDETKKKFIFGLAKPCEGCTRAITTYDINKIVYTLDNTGYQWLNVKT